MFYRDEKDLKEKCINAGLIVVSANEETAEVASKIILSRVNFPVRSASVMIW